MILLLKKPKIIMLASRLSEYGDFKEFLLESNSCSVLLIRNERVSITKGACFQLNEMQAKIIIELLMMDKLHAEVFDDLII